MRPYFEKAQQFPENKQVNLAVGARRLRTGVTAPDTFWYIFENPVPVCGSAGAEEAMLLDGYFRRAQRNFVAPASTLNFTRLHGGIGGTFHEAIRFER